MSFIQDYTRMIIRDRYLRYTYNGDDATKKVLRDGIAVIPNFIDREQAIAMSESIPADDALTLSPEGTNARFLVNADRVEAFAPFFNSTYIEEIAKTVIGEKASLFRAVAQKKSVAGITGSFDQLFHMDTWRYRFKTFLYLNDVTEENGPFVYVPKTHYGIWKLPYDLELKRYTGVSENGFVHEEDAQFAGCLLPHKANSIFKSIHTTPRTVTGLAGTLILFDARGIHKITPFKSGERKILSSYWIEEGKQI